MHNRNSDIVTVYTDGGSVPNPGTGGWAAVLSCKGHTKEIRGGERSSTNNRMELTAAIRALDSLKKPCRVKLYTDSQYLRKGITEWMPSWKAKNWARKGGALKNVDLWKRLDQLASIHDVEWHWVRGHAGTPGNERCDELVGMAIKEIQAKQ